MFHQVPLAFVYRGSDGIAPAHQGQTISRLTGGVVPVRVLSGAGHSPMSEMPDAFCEALREVLPHARRPEATACVAIPLDRYRSSYSTAVTTARIADLYETLINDDRKDVAP